MSKCAQNDGVAVGGATKASVGAMVQRGEKMRAVGSYGRVGVYGAHLACV